AISWSKRPSQFLAELGVSRPSRVAPPAPRAEPVMDDPLYEALATWRRERARSDEVPAYIVFPNKALAAIAGARPRSRQELAQVPGVGPVKVDRYGDDVLAVVAQ